MGAEEKAKASRVWQDAEVGSEPSLQQANPRQSGKDYLGARSQKSADIIAWSVWLGVFVIRLQKGVPRQR
ncbi:MAG TPA: hypothetical protein DHV57_15585 [Hyphomonas sp.]|nr:hypothetical protein [Hyphomonas sp.]MAN91665.1 hypothetical protein [Hyphomonadaceae bacterium]HBL93750.1 hypothetical protein [Hyphomonas sp.]HCJ18830.1 hypothetical protein [Hyphomonas sp.]